MAGLSPLMVTVGGVVGGVVEANFTSRILEGLKARRGLVEPREGSWLLGARPHSPLGRTGRGVGYNRSRTSDEDETLIIQV
jgi:hypothetical protein